MKRIFQWMSSLASGAGVALLALASPSANAAQLTLGSNCGANGNYSAFLISIDASLNYSINCSGTNVLQPPVCSTPTVSPGTNLATNGSATLSVSCTNSPTGYAWTAGSNPAGVTGTLGTASTTGSLTFSNTGTYNYSVTASNNGGTSAVVNAPAIVVTAPVAPSGCTVSASPASITAQNSTTLSVTCSAGTAPITYAWHSPAGGPAATASNSSSSGSLYFATAGSYAYSVDVTNNAGSLTGGNAPGITMNVGALVAPTCTPAASPASVAQGASTTLTANCTSMPAAGATGYAWTTPTPAPANWPTASGTAYQATLAFPGNAAASTAAYGVTATNGAGTSAAATASVTVTAVASCTVVDATAWSPGNVSTPIGVNTGSSAPGVTTSYKFTAAQLITGAPTKAGNISFNETFPGPQFEISNLPCDMTMPLPALVGSDASSFEVCARVGAGGIRFPTMDYMDPANPGAYPNVAHVAAYENYGYCTLMPPDAGNFYYLNVKPAAGCGTTCSYQIWFSKK